MGPSRRSPLTWLGGLLALYLAVPLALFVVRLTTSSQRGFHTPGLFEGLGRSGADATISLVLITVLGVPLAYVLARSTSRLASVVGLVVQLPLALPPLMSGLILIYLVGPYTFLGRLFGGRLTDSTAGIVIAMSFVAAPYLIVATRAAFVSMDQGMLDVAAALGHGDVSRFWHVALPAASPGLRAGMVLTWLRAFGEFGAVVILAYNPTTLPIYTYNQFSGVGLPTTLAPTALALGAGLAVAAIMRARRPRPSAIKVPSARAPTPSSGEPVRFDLDLHVGSFRLVLAQPVATTHLAILGPSGSGKSTLLRALAGLYGAAPGPVYFGGTAVRDVPVERRHVGYVAQGFSLYPHLTVWRHLMFSREATPERASYWLERLRLGGLENRFPSELSGGQRQRVGFAQALCRSPRVLLLDEPFSALDVPVRLELRRELRRLQRETGVATVLVTHDPEEAAFLAEEITVLAAGRALQSGTTREIFARPSSPDVARLLGVANFQRATVAAEGELDAAGARVSADTAGMASGTPVLWSIRPERIALRRASPGVDAPSGTLTGRVSDVIDVGLAVDLVVQIAPGVELLARCDDDRGLAVGDACVATLARDGLSVWSASPEANAPHK